MMDVLLNRANINTFKLEDRVELIFGSLNRLNIVIFDKMVRKFTILWRGENKDNNETNAYVSQTKGKALWSRLKDRVMTDPIWKHGGKKKCGQRAFRSTKDKMLNALIKAIEKENIEFLAYVFHTLPVQDQSIIFHPKNGIHHSMKNGKTLIQVLAEKGKTLDRY